MTGLVQTGRVAHTSGPGDRGVMARLCAVEFQWQTRTRRRRSQLAVKPSSASCRSACWMRPPSSGALLLNKTAWAERSTCERFPVGSPSVERIRSTLAGKVSGLEGASTWKAWDAPLSSAAPSSSATRHLNSCSRAAAAAAASSRAFRSTPSAASSASCRCIPLSSCSFEEGAAGISSPDALSDSSPASSEMPSRAAPASTSA
mmetsp:Transcript_24936/g.82938  ORF Transcript_24936/g.82938 Transcript_24936/m.82938 type:complete len:203 (+) Transcript_24936:92-700(+)